MFFKRGGSLWAQISEGRGRRLTNHSLYQSSRSIALSCGIKIFAVHHLVLSQSTRVTDGQTDRQTDRITTPKTALAYARAVKIAICEKFVLTFSFYRATACNATHGIAVAILSVCTSVRPSVRCVYCEKTKQHTANILIPHETAITLVFWQQQWLVGDAPFPLKSALKVTHPLRKKADFDRFPLITSQP